MTATDELRRLLDERGIEHDDESIKSAISYCDGYEGTYWDGDSFGYVEPIRPKPNTIGSHPELTIHDCTPEQAIAATLGSGTHPYEQRIVGDGSSWGEVMRDAYDNLMAAAGESCSPDELAELEAYIHAERTCHNATNDIFYTFMCSECGYTEEQGIPDYCAGCGAKVEHG